MVETARTRSARSIAAGAATNATRSGGVYRFMKPPTTLIVSLQTTSISKRSNSFNRADPCQKGVFAREIQDHRLNFRW